MAIVKFIGDPCGQEHQVKAIYKDIHFDIGVGVKVSDEVAEKLAKNSHFEVTSAVLSSSEDQTDTAKAISKKKAKE